MTSSRRILLALAGVLSLAAACLAQAPLAPQEAPPQKPGGSWWNRVWRDYHRNQAWPDPFIPIDRAAVKAPFLLMADNGWQRQNLLCEYHFTDDGQTLTEAGQYRVNWIATQAPQGRRTVFVQRGATPAATQARLEAVQQTIGHMVLVGPPPRVVESSMDSSGYAGDEVDAVSNSVGKTRPDPRLPTATPTAVSN